MDIAPEGGRGHDRGFWVSAFLNRYGWLCDCVQRSGAFGDKESPEERKQTELQMRPEGNKILNI